MVFYISFIYLLFIYYIFYLLYELLEVLTPCQLCVLGLDVGSVINCWPGGKLKSHNTSFTLFFKIYFFQKVVQEELDALLEQQGTIENKMVALHRMG